MLVDDAEVHEAVRLQILQPEALQRQLELHALLDEALQRLQQRLVGVEVTGLERGHEGGGAVGHRLQAVAMLLRHRLQQRGDLLLQQARHQPFTAVGRDLVQHRQRHRQGHAVVRLAGLVQVGERQFLAQHLEARRKAISGHPLGVVAHQLVARQVQQLRIGLLGRLAPCVERSQVEHIRGNLAVVESLDQRLVDQHIGATRLVLEALDLRHQALVVRKERHGPGRPLGDVPGDQPFADEQFAAQPGVDLAVRHATPRIQHQPMHGAALPGAHAAGAPGPVRLEHRTLQQVGADLLHPLRLDARDAAAKQPAGLDQLGGHDPLARLLRQRRAGMRPELDAARAQIRTGLRTRGVLDLAAHMAEQTGEQRLVDGLIVRWQLVFLPAVLGAQHMQLGVHVAPLAHAHVRQEMLLAPGLLLAARFVALDLVPRLPQMQVPQELRALVLLAAAKPCMRLVGRARAVLRALARILHRQRGGDHQQLGEAAAVARSEDHAADLGVERQLAEFAADRRQLARLVVGDRAEFGQQRIAVADQARAGRIDEGEVLDRAQLQRLHAQDHAGERGAQDLGIGMRRPPGEVVLVVEAEADAVHHPAAAAGALLRSRLRDLLDLQLLDLVARRVALDPRQAGVDHVADARHGERGFGDVGRQHHAPAAGGREHSRLLLRRLAREQRQDLGARQVVRLAQRLGRLADLAFAGQEHQHVARAAALRLVHRIHQGIEQVAAALALLPLLRALVGARRRQLVVRLDRPPAHLDRIQPAGHFDHRRRTPGGIGEMPGEALGVERGRGDDELEVGAPGQQRAQVAEQEVDVEAALVRLVDDDRVVGGEQRIGLRLGEQDAVGHQLDVAGRAQLVGEADLVAHCLAERAVQLLRDAGGGGARRQPARLRVADEARGAATEREADLGQLRGLARARLTADDDDLVRGEHAGDLLAPPRHRQLGGEIRLRQRRDARCQGCPGALEQGVELGLKTRATIAGAAIPALARAAAGRLPARRPAQVARHAAQTRPVRTQAVVEGRRTRVAPAVVFNPHRCSSLDRSAHYPFVAVRVRQWRPSRPCRSAMPSLPFAHAVPRTEVAIEPPPERTGV